MLSIEQEKQNRHCQHSKGMAQLGTTNVKAEIAIPRERDPSKKQGEKRGYTEMGNPNTCSREVDLRKGEGENHSEGARPLNLLNISLCGLASLPFLLAPRRSHPCSKHPRPMCVHGKTKETS